MKKKLSVVLVVVLTGLAASAWSPSSADKQKVVDDLKAAFTGETTASAKYAAFAEKAKDEGLMEIALLFRAASKAESIHAGNHKAALEQLGEDAPKVVPNFEVKSTKDNLKEAIKGETYESTTMYPGFIQDGNEAGVTIALITFNYAYKTELKHKALYEHALQVLETGETNQLATMYQVCTTCGNTYADRGPARCGICMTSNEKFITVE